MTLLTINEFFYCILHDFYCNTVQKKNNPPPLFFAKTFSNFQKRKKEKKKIKQILKKDIVKPC